MYSLTTFEICLPHFGKIIKNNKTSNLKTKNMRKLRLNIDRVIGVINDKNPGKPPTNREKYAKKHKITYQTLVNYKAGKLPAIIKLIKSIRKETGLSFDEIITYIK